MQENPLEMLRKRHPLLRRSQPEESVDSEEDWGDENDKEDSEEESSEPVRTPLGRRAGPPITERPRQGRVKNFFFNLKEKFENVLASKWFKIGGGIVLAAIILIVALNFLGPSGPEMTTPVATQPAEIPTFEPQSTVDYKSVPVVGTTLIMLLFGLMLVSVLGVLDGKERFQISDVIFALTGFFLNYFVSWTPMLAFLTAFEPLANPRTALFFVAGVTLAVVTVKALTGGRDTTNLGVFFACLGFAGAIFGTMGAFQIALDVPTQPVYLLQDLPAAILTKQASLIQYSLLVYSMFFLSIGCYLIDIFLPKDKETRWEALITASIVVGGFYLAQIWMGLTASMLVAVAAAVVLATIVRRSGKGITTGENPLSRAVSRAFEYTAWDGIAIGVVITILLRLSGFA